MKVVTSCNGVPVIGIMAAGAPGPVESFKAGMRDYGFIEGQTVRYELRVSHGDSTRLFGFADELVRASVDLIAVVGAVTARAAQKATQYVPIVYAVVVDPVSDGLATLSGEPLGNMTGMTTYARDQARMHIALLRSVKPDVARIALLADSAVSDCLVQANMRAAHEAGVQPQVLHITGPDPDFAGAFAAMQRDGSEALLVLEHPINGANAAPIAELALAHRLPTGLPRAQADAADFSATGPVCGPPPIRWPSTQVASFAAPNPAIYPSRPFIARSWWSTSGRRAVSA